MSLFKCVFVCAFTFLIFPSSTFHLHSPSNCQCLRFSLCADIVHIINQATMSDMAFCYSSDVCVICLSGFSDNTGPRVTVHEKGLASLIRCCQSAENQQLREYLLSGPENVCVHAACRKAFTKKRSADDADSSGSGPQNVSEKSCGRLTARFSEKLVASSVANQLSVMTAIRCLVSSTQPARWNSA